MHEDIAPRDSAQATNTYDSVAYRHVLARMHDLHGSMAAELWLWPCTFVGARARTHGRPRILNRGRIEIHDDVVIESRFSRAELVTSKDGRIIIGSRCVVEHGAIIVASGLIEIGDGVRIGPYCILCDTDAPDLATATPSGAARAIWVGDEVSIGPRVTVLPGTVIGAHSHVLPGSIVVGDIPPGVIAGGNPARPLRKRAVAATPVPSGLALGLATNAPAGSGR